MTFTKTPKSCSIIVLALTSVITSGCSSVTAPPAQSYTVWVGTQIIQAKSVSIHGGWVSMAVDKSPTRSENDGNITILAPVSSVVFIEPNKTK
jgi:hypothetical protein